MSQITRVRFVGRTVPLVMHNGQMADPLNPHTKRLKALTGKKKKTEAELLEIQRVEWEGGLYYDPKVGVFIPAEALEACIINGAKVTRRGKDFKAAIFLTDRKIPLKYVGPKGLPEMWESGEFKDIRGVVVAGKRVMRCRPLFNPEWSVEFDIEYDDINESDLLQVCEDAGRKSGLCEMRPRFGRFQVEKVEAPVKGKKSVATPELVGAGNGAH